MEPKDLFPYLEAHSKETVYKKLVKGTIGSIKPYAESGGMPLDMCLDINTMLEAYLEAMDKTLADYNFMKDLQEKIGLIIIYYKNK